MSSATEVLNPTLFARLQLHFGDVKISHPGEARVTRSRSDPPSEETRLEVVQHGEAYLARCAFCHDRGHNLSVSYLWGWRDRDGDQHWNLAYCHRSRCLFREENRQALVHMLQADDGLLERAIIRRGHVLSSEERAPRLPEPLIRLVQLSKHHPAHRALAARGFDPGRLGKLFDLHYCDGGADGLARDRVILPIYRSGQLQGWQSLAPWDWAGSDEQRLQYLSGRGLRVSELVYHLDEASQYHTGVIVRQPHDVWTFGAMAACVLGRRFMGDHHEQVQSAFREGTVVLLLPEATLSRRDVKQFIKNLQRHMPGRVAAVPLPADLPDLPERRIFLRDLVREKAKEQGVRVSYLKRE